MIPETWDDQKLKNQRRLATDTFAVGPAATDPREAAPDAALVDSFIVAALSAAQAIANVIGDNDVKEYVRHISADQRQVIGLVTSMLILSVPDTWAIIMQQLLVHEIQHRTNLASELGVRS